MALPAYQPARPKRLRHSSAVGAYPEIEPLDEGMLDVGEGNRIYWEVAGDPDGKPAVVLHGGPGSGAAPWWRRLFDPRAYRVVLFDQRGCGGSVPHAADPSTSLSHNTTANLLADIELLREHLRVDRWLVLGGSWGSTLGLAYAQRHRERVSELVVFSVVTTTRAEVEWVTRDVGRLFPVEWSRFRDGAPAADRGGSLAEAYSRLLHDPDPSVREQAARDWCDWEDAHVKAHPDQPGDPRYADPSFRMCFARLVTHYWRHAAWLDDGSLLRGAPELAGIPGVLIHGRRDVSSPLDVPWKLAQAWPGSELVIVDDAGHGAGGTTTELIVSSTDRFAGAWKRPA
jgi:proline iminopeptidase